MLDLKEVRRRLSDKNLSRVARETGLNYNYIYAVIKGGRDNPGYEFFKKLADYAEVEVCECHLKNEN